MKTKYTKQSRLRVTAAALAGLGLLWAIPFAAADPAGANSKESVETVAESGEGGGASATDTMTRAMRQAELAIVRAADVGKSVAFRLTAGVAPNSLVVPGPDMKSEDADRLAEDLGVMSRILEKAIGRGPDGPAWFGSVLGVGPGKNPDAYYLDGFGALFLQRVDFPLTAPAAGKAETEPEGADRTWEATRRELREGAPGKVRIWDIEDGRLFRGDRVEYDAGRVKELKDSLLETFKHASNLTGLRADEAVVVTVFGPPGAPEPTRFALTGARTAASPGEPAGRTGSILTLRARKADIDAFAKGRLSVEEFGRKVQETLR